MRQVLHAARVPHVLADERDLEVVAQQARSELWVLPHDLDENVIVVDVAHLLLLLLLFLLRLRLFLGLLLRGQDRVAKEQVEDMIEVAIGECDRFYPAFQLVLLADQSPAEALQAAMVETVGEA